MAELAREAGVLNVVPGEGETAGRAIGARADIDDLNVAHRVSPDLRSGTVSASCFSEGDQTAALGGFHWLGFGGRCSVHRSWDQYVEPRSVWMTMTLGEARP